MARYRTLRDCGFGSEGFSAEHSPVNLLITSPSRLAAMRFPGRPISPLESRFSQLIQLGDSHLDHVCESFDFLSGVASGPKSCAQLVRREAREDLLSIGHPHGGCACQS